MSIETSSNYIGNYERKEVLRDTAEEAEFVVCQRSVLAQACGRRLDPEADAVLLRTINDTSQAAGNDGEFVLACGVTNCDRVDEVVIETGGILRHLEGDGVCHETSVMIGKSILSEPDFI